MTPWIYMASLGGKGLINLIKGLVVYVALVMDALEVIKPSQLT